MAMTTKAPDRAVIGVESALSGILALLIDEREDRTRRDNGAVKTEVLLSQAGLSVEEIATVSGKKYDAVRMTIKRSRKARISG